MATQFGLLIAAAYLVGSVPAAYLAAKWLRGTDIRRYGSGNVGATNLLGLTSTWLAIPVIIFDLGKGAAMAWTAQLSGLNIWQQVTVGLAAIAGHNWPVFLRFNGGRGVLTTLGLATVLPWLNDLLPWGILAFGAIALFNIFIIHNMPLGIVAGIASLPLVSWGLGEPFPLTWGYLAMLLILVIRRLAVRPPVWVASVSTRQRLVNRLLFDRDLTDREAWIKLVWEYRKKTREGKK
jgi:glycerol-3-phosphate acyltransferase PlsY